MGPVLGELVLEGRWTTKEGHVLLHCNIKLPVVRVPFNRCVMEVYCDVFICPSFDTFSCYCCEGFACKQKTPTLPRHLVSIRNIWIPGLAIVLMGTPMILPYPFGLCYLMIKLVDVHYVLTRCSFVTPCHTIEQDLVSYLLSIVPQ